MADVIISIVVQRVTVIIEEQIRNEVNLVRGVKKEVLNLSCELKKIRFVLEDADRREYQDKSIKNWLKRLQNMSYEMDDVLDEWNIAILNLQMGQSNATVAHKHMVCLSILSSCLCFKEVVVHRDIAKKIKNVKEQLDQILAEKDRYNFVMSQPITDPSSKSWRVQSSSLVDLAKVHGRDRDRNILVSKLMANGGSQVELGVHVLSIVGGGGLGKTTLAQLAYNDNQVKEYFELRIWICVSDPFDEVTIAKMIVESVEGKASLPSTDQLEMLLQRLRASVLGKKFLLVLDDVWTQDDTKWEPLKNSLKWGGAGSKILVTTRKEMVAKMMGTIDNEIWYLEKLSDEDCWLVLCQMAIFGRNEEELEKFQDTGKKIANKCKGLPLAAKVLGSLLRSKNSLKEWESVLNSEIWQLEEAEVDIFPHLLLSYNELSPVVKQCFSYCAIFPKDYEIDVRKLIGNWMALGYLGSNVGSAGDMELKGRKYFENLAMRSLFQDIIENEWDGEVVSCKMHDIVHDFAQFLRNAPKVEPTRMKRTTCQVCDPLLVNSVKEYRSLFWEKEPNPPNICDCLISLRALQIPHCNLPRIPQGMENLIHLRWLDLSENKLSKEDTEIICKLYNLQSLYLQQCGLQGIPMEIKNLVHLRHLDLAFNKSLRALPESICDLRELQSLDIRYCCSLRGLPQSIHRLTNLKYLYNKYDHNLSRFPQGLAQLTGLRTLTEFRGGSGCSKFGLLKDLNCLSKGLELQIRSSDDLVEDVREAELRKKKHIRTLSITFLDQMDNKEGSSMDVLDALQPHPNLRHLGIYWYKGSKLPGWIASPIQQLRYIKLSLFSNLPFLPPLGKLPCLEQIYIERMRALQFVGREFLGITTAKDTDTESSTSSVAAATDTICFPKLKKLRISSCTSWKEWEDITAGEEESIVASLMPCLTELTIISCTGLTALPHRLLHKASLLKFLDISGSTKLQQRYGDKDGSAWKSISQTNPGLQVKL